MGCGARQLGRAAGVEVGENESRGVALGGGEREQLGSGAMHKLRQGFCAVDAVWAVQGRGVLRAGVPGRAFQRSQGDVSGCRFVEWFGLRRIKSISTHSLLWLLDVSRRWPITIIQLPFLLSLLSPSLRFGNTVWYEKNQSRSPLDRIPHRSSDDCTSVTLLHLLAKKPGKDSSCCNSPHQEFTARLGPRHPGHQFCPSGHQSCPSGYGSRN